MHHQTNGGDESETMKKGGRIAAKSGKKLKEEFVEMYPKLFKVLGRMEPKYHIKLNYNSISVKEGNNWFT